MILNGTYEHTLSRDEKTGSTLFTIRTSDFCNIRNRYGSVLCSAYIPRYTKGAPLRVRGEIENGRLVIDEVKEGTDKESVLIDYLSSGICSGLGKATAIKIVKEFGIRIFDIIKEPNAEILITNKINSFPLEKAEELVHALRHTSENQEVVSYISKYGGTILNAFNICEYCGRNSLPSFLNNIYFIGKEIGMDFAVCDRIAKENKLAFNDKKRVEIFVENLLHFCTVAKGNTYTTMSLLMKTSKLIEQRESAFQENITPGMILLALLSSEYVVLEKHSETKIYPKYLWNAEKKIAQELTRLENGKKLLDFHIEDIIQDDIQYDQKQLNSLNVLKSTGIKIITGGPGTGKTTTIKKIIAEYERILPYNMISLCAPTGRAAQRMEESTKRPASTIHSLIEYKPFGKKDSIYKDYDNPIESDLVIVDEMSMTDTILLAMLLGAIKTGTMVILVGDVNQLPSVGPGNVLKDLIESNKFETYIFKTIFRQAEASLIVQNAYKIINGELDLFTGEDFKLIQVSSVQELQREILQLTQKYYNKENLFETQVLTSTKKYEAGVYDLNRNIQEQINATKDEVTINGVSYKKNDKIMMITNNSEKSYSNGDIGYIKSNTNGLIIAEINGKEVEIGYKEMDEMMLAYASTIHKSQGSEYPIVIISLPKTPYIMLKRNLLYTAITRASQKVIIVYEDDALQVAINNIDDSKRMTGLIEKINGIKSKIYRKRR